MLYKFFIIFQLCSNTQGPTKQRHIYFNIYNNIMVRNVYNVYNYIQRICILYI